jgi:putative membrane protein
MKRTLIVMMPCAVWLAACTPNATDDTGANSAGASGAQSATEAQTDTAKTQIAADDLEFMKDAARGGVAEVKMGELGQSNGESQQVKEFAKKLADDHTKANEELKQLAAKKGVTLPEAMNEQQKSMIQHLSSLKGREFDSAFKQHAVEDHQKDIEKFKTASEKAKDPELKAFASKTLPVLQQHLDLAKQLNAGPVAAQPPQ